MLEAFRYSVDKWSTLFKKKAKKKKIPQLIVEENQPETDPSGKSLSNSRLQSTTGPPVPMRSLDCRLTEVEKWIENINDTLLKL